MQVNLLVDCQLCHKFRQQRGLRTDDSELLLHARVCARGSQLVPHERDRIWGVSYGVLDRSR